MFNIEAYNDLIKQFGETVQLVAVSKFKSREDILQAYAAGQRDFGETG